MIRQIIAGLALALAAAGCHAAGEPADVEQGDEADTEQAESALVAKEGEPCGGFAGTVCDDGLFCDFPIEAACGSGDREGTCTAPPGACIPVMKAVCGCDGNTYSNACAAAQAMVSVAHTGACK